MQIISVMSTQDYMLSFLERFVTPSLASFSNRLTIQKLIFLAEKTGSDFGFTFGWHINGPYSPSLTREVYSVKLPDGSLHFRRFPLEKKDEEVIRKLKSVLGSKVSDPRYLELIASVWYCLPTGGVTKEQEIQTINTMASLKPQFSRAEVEDAIARIRKLGD